MAIHQIAIIGVACRFPGEVYDLEDYWSLLARGIDAVTEIGDDRFDTWRFRHPRRSTPGRSITMAAGLVANHRYFDAGFFGISPKEASVMDPQQRMALEMTWEAMEDAGIPPSRLKGLPVGVYMGAASQDASLYRSDDFCHGNEFTMLGLNLSIIANRISYCFDFRGPSLVIDTACSSVLVALHQACLALTYERLPYALAGGVNFLYAPMAFVGFSRAGMLAEDGRCRAFDAEGQGYVRAEGGAVLLLKPLNKALADGDRIHAVIRATDTNVNGRGAGLAAPDQEAQYRLLKGVYGQKGLRADRLAYLEAHGTGTAIGDPIEARAIGRALPPADRRGRLWMGSVKTNLGHLETASGGAGLLKAVLVLQKRAIPPSLHFNTPNPAIDFDGLGLAVPTKLEPLPETEGPALVGVNSFGFGGTNAHAVLEEAPFARVAARPPEAAVSSAPESLFLAFSAQSRESLNFLAEDYADYLEAHPETPVEKLASSILAHREALPHRLVVSAGKRSGVVEHLRQLGGSEALASREVIRGEAVPEPARTVFMFSGNGAVWPGMGQGLLEKNAVFLEQIREIDSLFRPLQGWSILDKLTNPPEVQDLHLVDCAQPLLFAVQAGLFRALETQGLRPDMVMGHSFGEVSAAWAAGILSTEEAVHLTYHRSRQQAKLWRQGGMAAVGISPDKAKKLIAELSLDLEIAAVNAPKNVTLVGPVTAFKALKARLKRDERRTLFIVLPVEYPFHSRALKPLKQAFFESLGSLNPGRGTLTFISTVSGREVRGTALTTEYWWRNIACPVLFQSALETALERGGRLFMEIGPHKTLGLYGREVARAHSVPAVQLHTLSQNTRCDESFDLAWKSAWTRGWPLDWRKTLPDPEFLNLPTYPWNREYVWSDPTTETQEIQSSPRDHHPLLGRALKGPAPAWENHLDTLLFPWLGDHKVGERAIFPAAGFVELALAAADRLFDQSISGVENLRLLHPLDLGPDQVRVLESGLRADDHLFRITSRKLMQSGEGRSIHAEGRLLADRFWAGPSERGELIARYEVSGERRSSVELYENTSAAGLNYGPDFQAVEELILGSEGILARLRSESAVDQNAFRLPPWLLDAAFQSLFIAGNGFEGTFLPYWLGRVRCRRDLGRPAYSLARIGRVSENSIVAEFELLDSQGRIVAQVADCRFIRTRAFAAPQSYYLKTTFLADEASRARNLNLSEFAAAVRGVLAQIQDREAASGTWAEPLKNLILASSQEFFRRNFPEETFSLTRLILAGQVRPEQMSYLIFLLEMLAEAGLATGSGDLWSLTASGLGRTFKDLWADFLAEYPEALAEARLTALTVSALEAGLIEKNPEPEVQEAEEAFKSRLLLSSQADCLKLDEILAAALVEPTHALDRTLRIQALLAVNGSFGLASAFLSRCKGLPLELTITSPDEDTLSELKTLWGENPDWRFEVLDVTRLEEGRRFDLAVVSHSLGRLSWPEGVLKRLKQALAPGGLLIVEELAPNDFYDFVFGQDPSWWRESSDPREPVSPLRGPEEWRELISEAGFAAAEFFGRPDQGRPFILAAQVPAGESVSRPRPPAVEAPWLLVTDSRPEPASGDFWEAVEAEWSETGLSLNRPSVSAADGFDPLSPSSWRSLLLAESAAKPLNLLFGLGLSADPESPKTMEIAEQRLAAALALVKGWEAAGRPALRLWLLSRGGFPAPLPEGGHPVPSQAGLWNFGRTLSNELSGLDVRLVDLQMERPDRNNARTLLDFALQVQAGRPEREAVILNGTALCPRLEAHSELKPSPAEIQDDDFYLGFEGSRKIEHLRWRAKKFSPPGPGEVKVAVRAVGLNFRDVMWASDLLPEQALEDGFSGSTLGLEGAGLVEETGPGVTGLVPGDRVMFFASQCFASSVITRAEAAIKLPDRLPWSAAATIPVTFCTAWYAMKHLAGLAPGESVLIHGAAGGVGQAAIQVARHLGLKIYASAGSKERRDFIRSLGVDRVVDSRSLSFAESIREWTGGRGVDAVLNSIAGEAAARSLSCLAPFGRFLELGKTDFYANAPMRLYPFRRNISYFGIDLDQLLGQELHRASRLAGEVMALFTQGVFHPLPHTVYGAERVIEAFKNLRASQQIGKIVISLEKQPARSRSTESRPPAAGLALRPEATYLITGGTSGFGLATARYLQANGARHLILLGRRAPAGEAAEFIETSRRGGFDAAAIQADVSDPDQLKTALDQALSSRPPLRGLVHAAAVFADSTILDMKPEDLQGVLAAKAGGAWNLHRYTRDLALDFFIMYSSATTVVGNHGQANYVAANGMLESLALHRQASGRPALTILWGAIADAGVITRRPELAPILERLLGEPPIKAAEALSFLPEFVASGQPVLARLRARWRKSRALPIIGTPLFSRLGAGTEESGDVVPLSELVAGQPPEKALETIIRFVAEKTSAVMHIPLKRISTDLPLASLGLDSLMAVELMASLEAALGSPLSSGALSSSDSIRSVAEQILLELYAGDHSLAASSEDLVFMKNFAKKHGVDLQTPQKG